MKFMSWLGKMILIVVMVSSLSMLTTGLVVNAYIKSMLASLNIQLEGQPFAWGSVLQGLMGKKDSTTVVEGEVTKDNKEEIAKEDNDKVVESSNGSKDTDTTNETGTTGNGGSSSGSGKEESPVDEEAPDGATPVMGEMHTEVAGVGQQDQVIVSPDDLVRKKDDLPASEKEEIFNILMTKLPQEKVQEITVAMENGLTEQELKQVEEIISKYLSDDEYAKLMKLLKS
ncbi:hypothetical protein [Paenibacillus macquariensis]|uniref:Uncharacterized protein n=1 Tax=Paenibacillus macquariensis TaxID=948756 RepID=A0ABY1KAC7_9BACL|nr:hypothetical protein [Paenibacillus macquariensis]MEC0093743.1 hypothetical protein [Paenibacillus macquariensis]OAB31687.1 hypothetical protein PMSM_19655 [Paenibacillus macquariensis subsp. macquariensis]SIR50125.1 hypothetical protein SAMN05421578_11645 [Paenibacillus macquariensis]